MLLTSIFVKVFIILKRSKTDFSDNVGGLDVTTCANQDPLLGTTGLVPLMGIDVWEHAYYVEYVAFLIVL